jgi:hypothetical protein
MQKQRFHVFFLILFLQKFSFKNINVAFILVFKCKEIE